jgi:hypothetical protein
MNPDREKYTDNYFIADKAMEDKIRFKTIDDAHRFFIPINGIAIRRTRLSDYAERIELSGQTFHFRFLLKDNGFLFGKATSVWYKIFTISPKPYYMGDWSDTESNATEAKPIPVPQPVALSEKAKSLQTLLDLFSTP